MDKEKRKEEDTPPVDQPSQTTSEKTTQIDGVPPSPQIRELVIPDAASALQKRTLPETPAGIKTAQVIISNVNSII
jgi:hypothetical protein